MLTEIIKAYTYSLGLTNTIFSKNGYYYLKWSVWCILLPLQRRDGWDTEWQGARLYRWLSGKENLLLFQKVHVLMPNIHIELFTTTCKDSTSESDILFWLPQEPSYPYMQTRRTNKLIKKIEIGRICLRGRRVR